MQQARTRDTLFADRNDDRPHSSESVSLRTEDIHIRNYDHQNGYVLDVTVLRTDGAPVARERYYLRSEETVSECDFVPSGEYEVRIDLETGDHESQTCRLGPGAGQTACIELGNGIVSLTEGFGPSRRHEQSDSAGIS